MIVSSFRKGKELSFSREATLESSPTRCPLYSTDAGTWRVCWRRGESMRTFSFPCVLVLALCYSVASPMLGQGALIDEIAGAKENKVGIAVVTKRVYITNLSFDVKRIVLANMARIVSPLSGLSIPVAMSISPPGARIVFGMDSIGVVGTCSGCGKVVNPILAQWVISVAGVFPKLRKVIDASGITPTRTLSILALFIITYARNCRSVICLERFRASRATSADSLAALAASFASRKPSRMRRNCQRKKQA